MSNYVKATNFAVKDSLGTSDPLKIIKGTEIDNEYNAIASAVSSKADTNSPTFTGTPLAPTAASGTSTNQIATTAFVAAATGTTSNIAGGGANRVVYQTALDTTGFAPAPTVSGTYLGWTGSDFAWSTVSASTSAALTMNNSGAGDSSGATFNGSIAKTISYNTIGAPSVTGTGATGTWGISITGSSGSTSYATSAGSCTGNAATVTNGVYTNVSNTLTGSGAIIATGTSSGDQRISVTYGGNSSGLSPTSLQLGSSGHGILNVTGGTWDGTNGVSLIMSGGAGTLQITSSDTLYTGADNCYKNGSTTAWIIASDARIKKNITPYTKGLAELNQVNIKNFEFNGLANSIDGSKAVGVIADEIESVLPDTIKINNVKLRPEDTERTALKHFDSTELVYLLVNSVKELKAELDAAKARITALENV